MPPVWVLALIPLPRGELQGLRQFQTQPRCRYLNASFSFEGTPSALRPAPVVSQSSPFLGLRAASTFILAEDAFSQVAFFPQLAVWPIAPFCFPLFCAQALPLAPACTPDSLSCVCAVLRRLISKGAKVSSS